MFHYLEVLILRHLNLQWLATVASSVKGVLVCFFCPSSGSWSIQFERGSGLVMLRSLHWQGFSFYHVPGTRKYGSVYVGVGVKNLDLPFML